MLPIFQTNSVKYVRVIGFKIESVVQISDPYNHVVIKNPTRSFFVSYSKLTSSNDFVEIRVSARNVLLMSCQVRANKAYGGVPDEKRTRGISNGQLGKLIRCCYQNCIRTAAAPLFPKTPATPTPVVSWSTLLTAFSSSFRTKIRRLTPTRVEVRTCV